MACDTPAGRWRRLLELRRRTGYAVFPVADQHGDAIGLISVVSAEPGLSDISRALSGRLIAGS